MALNFSAAKLDAVFKFREKILSSLEFYAQTIDLAQGYIFRCASFYF